jgi:hypothetical protein
MAKTYPTKLGDTFPHPLNPTKIIEVFGVWDDSLPYSDQMNNTLFPYRNTINSRLQNPPQGKDIASLYPIYQCSVNGGALQWIVFTWLPIAEGLPIDILR